MKKINFGEFGKKLDNGRGRIKSKIVLEYLGLHLIPFSIRFAFREVFGRYGWFDTPVYKYIQTYIYMYPFINKMSQNGTFF